MGAGEDASKQESLNYLKSNLEMYLDHLSEAQSQVSDAENIFFGKKCLCFA